MDVWTYRFDKFTLIIMNFINKLFYVYFITKCIFPIIRIYVLFVEHVAPFVLVYFIIRDYDLITFIISIMTCLLFTQRLVSCPFNLRLRHNTNKLCLLSIQFIG